uniref:DNA polymerase epsilon subunit 3 n=1 Tax=Pseudonaja textilis TaxID=8673 RepID=A0A670YRI3_PSETE
MAERPEDLNLPNAVITRIIKEALPDGVNVSKEARSAISRAASVFVLYATSCANNFARKGKRKTLNAGDVISAMEEMEFQRFVGPLKESLEGKCTLVAFCTPSDSSPCLHLLLLSYSFAKGQCKVLNTLGIFCLKIISTQTKSGKIPICQI